MAGSDLRNENNHHLDTSLWQQHGWKVLGRQRHEIGVFGSDIILTTQNERLQLSLKTIVQMFTKSFNRNLFGPNLFRHHNHDHRYLISRWSGGVFILSPVRVSYLPWPGHLYIKMMICHHYIPDFSVVLDDLASYGFLNTVDAVGPPVSWANGE